MDGSETVRWRQALARAVWRKPRTCSSGECVEVASVDGKLGLRSSQEPQLTLLFTDAEWREFVHGVKAGDFDNLLPPE